LNRKKTLTQAIRKIGTAAGLDALGFAEAAPFGGYALHDSPRRDPRLSLPGARSIVVAGVYIGGLTLPAWEDPWWGRTSRLYLSGYFLDVVAPLAPIVDLLQAKGHRAVLCDGGTQDGSVLPLKLAAVRAGLGWQGKHSLLISKTYGTFLAMGGLITDAQLDVNTQMEPNRCRTCDLCQTACPVDALAQPHVLARQRCLSHQLQAEVLSPEARAAMGNRVGDCEICQNACPWNRKHLKSPLPTQLTTAFQEQIAAWERFFHLPHLAELSEEGYRAHLGPLNTQIPYQFFRRNTRLAMANARETGAPETTPPTPVKIREGNRP
jgi:epoxyqueuosine reductase